MGKVDSELESGIAGKPKDRYRGECAGKGHADRKGDGKPSEHACHYISLELVSGTLCCHHPDKV